MRTPEQYPDIHLPKLMGRALEMKGILHSWVSEDYRAKSGYDITTNSVTICTIHSVKGLDYDCVFVVGLDSIEPGRWSEEQIKSLTYVAITRAKYQWFDHYRW